MFKDELCSYIQLILQLMLDEQYEDTILNLASDIISQVSSLKLVNNIIRWEKEQIEVNELIIRLINTNYFSSNRYNIIINLMKSIGNLLLNVKTSKIIYYLITKSKVYDHINKMMRNK